jgi:hypothetical protein
MDRCRWSKIGGCLATAISAACATAGAVSAQAPAVCPDDAKATITLAMPDGRTRVHERLDADRVAVVDSDTKGGKNTTVRYRGLLPLSFEGTGGKSKIIYKSDLAGIFPLQVAKEHTLEQSIEVEGQPSMSAKMVVVVLAKETVKIGACSYETFRIGRATQFVQNGAKSPITHDMYAPALGIVVKTTMLNEDGTVEMVAPRFEFESIVAK